MNRTTKIGLVLAFIVLGVGVIAFWPWDGEPELSITYAGPSRNNPASPFFTVTNRSKYSFTCFTYITEHRLGESTNTFRPPTPGNRGWYPPAEQLDGHSARNYNAKVSSGNGWRMDIAYHQASTNSMAFRTRLKLAGFASNHGYLRFFEWIRPKERWKSAFGPEMLGNKPAPPEQK